MTNSKKLRICFLSAVAVTIMVAGSARATLFEDLSISPRARAMGEASIAARGDAWAFYHNPAALAFLNHTHVSTSTAEPFNLDFTRLSALGASAKLPGDRGGVAFGYRYFSVDFKDQSLSKEQSLTFAHGITLFQDASSSLHFGWAADFHNLELAETVGGLDPGSAWAVGLNVGVMATLYERTTAGFYIRNMNNPTIGIDQEELTQLVGVGIAYEPYEGVTTTFDIRNQLGEEMRFHGGTEFAVTEYLDLRVGIETDPNKYSFGFGVNVPKVASLHYAFSSGGGTLDASHQFGVSVLFNDGDDE